MTDLTPNDLSHMSDEDFNALCPQGHHAPGAEPLSHAAQAVLYAFTEDNSLHDWKVHIHHLDALAAALRAAADQMSYAGADEAANWLAQIATELEGQ